ncbi:hypothetical protein [Microbacterium sp. NPDC076895]|uniref:hypothetical protein n=1 Tax=Microbacterium sp. NPDC076895 TaxID=3154957 RepID=UPI00341FB749
MPKSPVKKPKSARAISWSATEPRHRRPWWWYVAVVWLTILLAYLFALLGPWWYSSSVVVVLAAVALLISTASKPRTWEYTLTHGVIRISIEGSPLERVHELTLSDFKCWYLRDIDLRTPVQIALVPKARFGMFQVLNIPPATFAEFEGDPALDVPYDIMHTLVAWVPYSQDLTERQPGRLLDRIVRTLRLG